MDTITRLVRYQRAPERATNRFRTWKHNKDVLPKVQLQLEMILQAYGKFQHVVVYDTQGIHDDGSDIVLHFRLGKDDGDVEVIGFQVKSFDDLSKKDYLKELKSQHFDSFETIRDLRYYFLLLCTDGKQHKDKVRSVMSEFKNTKRTEVVEPAFAYTFLHHPQTRIEALIKRTMEADDIVFREALESLDLESPSARALAIYLTVRSVLTGDRHFVQSVILADSTLRTLYGELRAQQAALLEESQLSVAKKRPLVSSEEDEDWDEEEEEPIQLGEFEDQMATDLDLLENDVVELDPASDDILLLTDQLRPLVAVISDALARYQHDEPQLMSYMFSLMGVRD